MNINELLDRRQFLQLSALGALGTVLLPGEVFSQSMDESVNNITVMGFVDVAQSLADGTVNGNAYWMDNNRSNGSSNEGTDSLITKLKPGDTVRWFVFSLEVETVVDIIGITGPAASISNPQLVETPYFSWWEGEIDETVSGIHDYSLELQVESQEMLMSSPLALRFD